MNAHLLARTGYASGAQPIRTYRGTEYDAFARCTRALTAAEDGPGGFPALVRALHDNRRLWTAIAADVSGDGNALPPALRARIFYLAEFTQVHSRKVLEGLADVSALVDINMAVMRGLRGQEAQP